MSIYRDYKSHEAGFAGFGINWGRAIIELFAWMGQAYDLKTVPMELAKTRMQRTGIPKKEDNHIHSRPEKIPLIKKTTSGTQQELEEEDDHDDHGTAWGWGDEEISDDHLKITQIRFAG